jgi:hypothetical protein
METVMVSFQIIYVGAEENRGFYQSPMTKATIRYHLSGSLSVVWVDCCWSSPVE